MKNCLYRSFRLVNSARRRSRLAGALTAALLLSLSSIAPSSADTWNNYLRNGSLIQVDPLTNRAMVTTPQGVNAPLWDGVHQLRDGSTVTVRSGIMVPNRAIMDMRQGYPDQNPPPIVEQEPGICEVLVRKTCGLHEECSAEQSCDLARQLHALYQQDQRESAREYSAFGSPAEQQCRQAMTEVNFFPVCKPRIGNPSACARLVSKVCGTADQCAAQESCSLAHQLLDQERDERLSSADSDVATGSTGQCAQALRAKDFFTACLR